MVNEEMDDLTPEWVREAVKTGVSIFHLSECLKYFKIYFSR